MTAAYLAAGIDPKRHIVFNQSQGCHQHAELAWIFNCVARMGWLGRMTQFKDKAGKDRENASGRPVHLPKSGVAGRHSGLPRHPCSGRARTRSSISNCHVDIAQKFNNDFAESIAAHAFGATCFFPLPEPLIQPGNAGDVAARTAPRRCRSPMLPTIRALTLPTTRTPLRRKSARPRPIRNLSPRRKRGWRRGRKPIISSASMRPFQMSRRRLCSQQFGGGQFSTFKTALVYLSVQKLGPIGAEMKRLVADAAYIDKVLAEGAACAPALAAEETMKAVKDIVGFIRS